jgi:hypothetical protein
MAGQDTDTDAAAQLLMMRLRNGGAPPVVPQPDPNRTKAMQLAALLRGK